MGSGDGLARVTYLPGVRPPQDGSEPEPTTASSDIESATDDSTAPVVPLPSMASVFGGSDEDHAPGEGEEAGAEQADSDEEKSSAPTARQTARAERVSMNALTRRGMSRWELENTLSARELDEHTVATELDRLEGVGLIDDAALAETIVRTQHERKGLGRSALTAELRRRHIDQQHIDEALAQIDDDDEQARATELALKRAPQLRSYDTETAKRRLSGFLMRKGYSGSVVRAAVDEALSDRSSGGGVRFR
jgi:regulatory protein